MSMLSRRFRLPVLAFLTLAFAVPAGAQERDPLAETRARLKVEAERLQKRYREGRLEAYALARTDPDKELQAVEMLIVLKVALNRDTSLPAETRQGFLRQLDRDITAVKAIIRDARRRDSAAARAARLAARSRPSPAEEGPKRAFETARDRFGKAGRRAEELAELKRLREGRYLRVGDDIARSAVLPIGDIEFPKDWAEKTKRRSPANKLTDKEKALLKSLQTPTSVEFERDTFSDVMDWFRKKMGQDIIVEKRALDERGIGYDSLVTLKLAKVSTRTALKRVLADLGLTYVLQDEAILVTSPERARQMVTTRAYYVGDLAPLTDIRFGPFIAQAQYVQVITDVIRQIVTNIEPDTWRINNPDAAGTIIFDPIRQVLIVRQSAELHYKLQGSLP